MLLCSVSSHSLGGFFFLMRNAHLDTKVNVTFPLKMLKILFGNCSHKFCPEMMTFFYSHRENHSVQQKHPSSCY